MRVRAAIAPFIAMLALFSLLGTGCFDSTEGGTVSDAVVIGAGEDQTTVGGDGQATGGAEETTATSEPTETETGETSETEETSETAETSEASETETGGGEDVTAARESFTNTCGGCHTLSDAGTTGNIGPNLDETSDDADAVEQQIIEGGGAMPPGLLQGDEAKAVAAYVAAVKSG